MLSSLNEARGDILPTIVGWSHRLEVLTIIVAPLVTFQNSSGISFLQRHDTDRALCGEDSFSVERAVLDK
jgi:hypothetical protein